jgi:hypothetical protein
MLEKDKAEHADRMQSGQTRRISMIYRVNMNRRITKGIQTLPAAALLWYVVCEAGVEEQEDGRKIEDPVGFRFLAGGSRSFCRPRPITPPRPAPSPMAGLLIGVAMAGARTS